MKLCTNLSLIPDSFWPMYYKRIFCTTVVCILLVPFKWSIPCHRPANRIAAAYASSFVSSFVSTIMHSLLSTSTIVIVSVLPQTLMGFSTWLEIAMTLNVYLCADRIEYCKQSTYKQLIVHPVESQWLSIQISIHASMSDTRCLCGDILSLFFNYPY